MRSNSSDDSTLFFDFNNGAERDWANDYRDCLLEILSSHDQLDKAVLGRAVVKEKGTKKSLTLKECDEKNIFNNNGTINQAVCYSGMGPADKPYYIESDPIKNPLKEMLTEAFESPASNYFELLSDREKMILEAAIFKVDAVFSTRYTECAKYTKKDPENDESSSKEKKMLQGKVEQPELKLENLEKVLEKTRKATLSGLYHASIKTVFINNETIYPDANKYKSLVEYIQYLQRANFWNFDIKGNDLSGVYSRIFNQLPTPPYLKALLDQVEDFLTESNKEQLEKNFQQSWIEPILNQIWKDCFDEKGIIKQELFDLIPQNKSKPKERGLSGEFTATVISAYLTYFSESLNDFLNARKYKSQVDEMINCGETEGISVQQKRRDVIVNLFSKASTAFSFQGVSNDEKITLWKMLAKDKNKWTFIYSDFLNYYTVEQAQETVALFFVGQEQKGDEFLNGLLTFHKENIDFFEEKQKRIKLLSEIQQASHSNTGNDALYKKVIETIKSDKIEGFIIEALPGTEDGGLAKRKFLSKLSNYQIKQKVGKVENWQEILYSNSSAFDLICRDLSADFKVDEANAAVSLILQDKIEAKNKLLDRLAIEYWLIEQKSKIDGRLYSDLAKDLLSSFSFEKINTVIDQHLFKTDSEGKKNFQKELLNYQITHARQVQEWQVTLSIGKKINERSAELKEQIEKSVPENYGEYLKNKKNLASRYRNHYMIEEKFSRKNLAHEVKNRKAYYDADPDSSAIKKEMDDYYGTIKARLIDNEQIKKSALAQAKDEFESEKIEAKACVTIEIAKNIKDLIVANVKNGTWQYGRFAGIFIGEKIVIGDLPEKSIKVPASIAKIYSICQRIEGLQQKLKELNSSIGRNDNCMPLKEEKEAMNRAILKAYQEIEEHGAKAIKSFSTFFADKERRDLYNALKDSHTARMDHKKSKM